jgi:shikimate 5-dehydrogenase
MEGGIYTEIQKSFLAAYGIKQIKSPLMHKYLLAAYGIKKIKSPLIHTYFLAAYGIKQIKSLLMQIQIDGIHHRRTPGWRADGVPSSGSQMLSPLTSPL